jgi:hypothetical protein
MNKFGIYIILLCLLTVGCEKKPSAADVKTHLEKAMTDHLLKGRSAGAAPPHFEIVDVTYFKIGEWYRCQFTVKLHRQGGTDTTGFIQGKISLDYATVIK